MCTLLTWDERTLWTQVSPWAVDHFSIIPWKTVYRRDWEILHSLVIKTPHPVTSDGQFLFGSKRGNFKCTSVTASPVMGTKSQPRYNKNWSLARRQHWISSTHYSLSPFVKPENEFDFYGKKVDGRLPSLTASPSVPNSFSSSISILGHPHPKQHLGSAQQQVVNVDQTAPR